MRNVVKSLVGAVLFLASVAMSSPAAAAETPKVAPTLMKQVIATYLDALERADVPAILALFSDDASVSQPAGSPPHKGKPALKQHYEGLTKKGGIKAELLAINPSQSDTAAMVLRAKAGETTIHIVEIFTFDPAGKITSFVVYLPGQP